MTGLPLRRPTTPPPRFDAPGPRTVPPISKKFSEHRQLIIGDANRRRSASSRRCCHRSRRRRRRPVRKAGRGDETGAFGQHGPYGLPARTVIEALRTVSVRPLRTPCMRARGGCGHGTIGQPIEQNVDLLEQHLNEIVEKILRHPSVPRNVGLRHPSHLNVGIRHLAL